MGIINILKLMKKCFSKKCRGVDICPNTVIFPLVDSIPLFDMACLTSSTCYCSASIPEDKCRTYRG